MDAGTYINSVTLEDESLVNNYNITYKTGTITISKREVLVSTNSVTKVYDGNYVTQNITCNDETIKANLEFDSNDIVNAGTYTNSVRLTNANLLKNYNITYNFGTITINKKDVCITTNSVNKTYNGVPLKDDNIELQYSSTDKDFDNILDNSQVKFLEKDAENAGTYLNSIQITFVDGATNYNISYNYGTIVIAKAKVDIYFASYQVRVGNTAKVSTNDISYYLNGQSNSSLKSKFTFSTTLDNSVKTSSVACTKTYALNATKFDYTNCDVTLHEGIITFY